MGKDTHLVNIYLKIHHKKPLTMDDLGYLAKYDPECFAKTCQNVIYNIPEAKPIMEPAAAESLSEKPKIEASDWQGIARVLERLKRLEMNALPEITVDNEKVKNLLGNLYMELLFPHNDQYTFMDMADGGSTSMFDRKV
ncbi:MAG: hypothetical protein NC123_07080 [Butyrivibrio sp.]|nr:hypothetical protein [Acetatifactor muris]MCM1559291.1 hypothetical protein [Butyrivibrio sp.]